MKASRFNYSVRLPFAASLTKPELLGQKFMIALDALTQIDSNVFTDWQVSDLPAMKGYPLEEVRSRIVEIVAHNVSRDDVGHADPASGYAAVAHTATRTKSHRMTLWVDAWNVWLKAGDVMVPPDPAMVTYPLFRAALLAINTIWQQPWACTQAFRSRTAKIPNGIEGGYSLKRLPMIPDDPTFPKSIYHIPWFAYLSAALASGVKLPPEIRTETLADGGLLMIATEERLDPDIPEHARRARILAERLIAQTGFTSWGKKSGAN